MTRRCRALATALGSGVADVLRELQDATDVTTAWAQMHEDFGLRPDHDALMLRSAMPERFATVQLPDSERAQPPNTLRLVCISDTHNRIDDLDPLPHGDVLIHAGDFTTRGSVREVVEFNRFLESQPHRHKIVIAGNHEMCFDKASQRGDEILEPEAVRALLTNCTYLEEQSIVVEGVRFFGSPYQPRFRNMAFNVDRGEPCRERWRRIPTDTDVLITHGPPLGYGDFCVSGQSVGCGDLLREVQTRVRPLLHIFGHIHECHGITTDGVTAFVNAASCNVHYRLVNSAIIVDMPLPSATACSESESDAEDRAV